MSNPNASYEHRMRGCPGNYKQAADARIAALEAKLAERDEALVVAWRLCLQEAWQDLRVHLNNERREG